MCLSVAHLLLTFFVFSSMLNGYPFVTWRILTEAESDRLIIHFAL